MCRSSETCSIACVMIHVNLKEYAALAISEPYVLEMDRKVTTSAIGH